MRVVDLNVDAGEGYDDDTLLPLVTSASLACGGHAGDAGTLRPVVAAAVACGVAIGAQVSYADREGFGRVELPTPPGELRRQLEEQCELLADLCADAGSRIRYLKPHGALYHRVLAGGPQAEVVVEVARQRGLPLLLMPGSSWPSVPEGFADRRYDGARLRSRNEPGAVLTDPEEAAVQAVALAGAGLRSLCVHGDSPGAATVLTACRSALLEAGWALAAFA